MKRRCTLPSTAAPNKPRRTRSCRAYHGAHRVPTKDFVQPLPRWNTDTQVKSSQVKSRWCYWSQLYHSETFQHITRREMHSSACARSKVYREPRAPPQAPGLRHARRPLPSTKGNDSSDVSFEALLFIDGAACCTLTLLRRRRYVGTVACLLGGFSTPTATSRP